MSWLSQFAQSFLSGAMGGDAVSAPTHPDQQPLVNALNSANQAGASLGSALSGAAVATLDGFLTTKVGPVGTEVVDLALQALIAEASSRLSPSAIAGGAHTAAAQAGAGPA